jgi:uroporphyrinogen-III decarboxylase
MVELIHCHGAKVRLHCHGKIGHVLDMMLETGADALDPLEAPPDGDILLAEVKRHTAGQVGLFGNLQLKLLEHGSTEQVRNAVARCMDAAKAGGHYVIMPTASPINTPLAPQTEENYLTFFDTALELGQY